MSPLMFRRSSQTAPHAAHTVDVAAVCVVDAAVVVVDSVAAAVGRASVGGCRCCWRSRRCCSAVDDGVANVVVRVPTVAQAIFSDRAIRHTWQIGPSFDPNGRALHSARLCE